MNWAVKNFCRAGDAISVLRAVEESVDTVAGSDQTSIVLGLQEQVSPWAPSLLLYDACMLTQHHPLDATWKPQ